MKTSTPNKQSIIDSLGKNSASLQKILLGCQDYQELMADNDVFEAIGKNIAEKQNLQPMLALGQSVVNDPNLNLNSNIVKLIIDGLSHHLAMVEQSSETLEQFFEITQSLSRTIAGHKIDKAYHFNKNQALVRAMRSLFAIDFSAMTPESFNQVREGFSRIDVNEAFPLPVFSAEGSIDVDKTEKNEQKGRLTAILYDNQVLNLEKLLFLYGCGYRFAEADVFRVRGVDDRINTLIFYGNYQDEFQRPLSYKGNVKKFLSDLHELEIIKYFDEKQLRKKIIVLSNGEITQETCLLQYCLDQGLSAEILIVMMQKGIAPKDPTEFIVNVNKGNNSQEEKSQILQSLSANQKLSEDDAQFLQDRTRAMNKEIFFEQAMEKLNANLELQERKSDDFYRDEFIKAINEGNVDRVGLFMSSGFANHRNSNENFKKLLKAVTNKAKELVIKETKEGDDLALLGALSGILSGFLSIPDLNNNTKETIEWHLKKCNEATQAVHYPNSSQDLKTSLDGLSFSQMMDSDWISKNAIEKTKEYIYEVNEKWWLEAEYLSGPALDIKKAKAKIKEDKIIENIIKKIISESGDAIKKYADLEEYKSILYSAVEPYFLSLLKGQVSASQSKKALEVESESAKVAQWGSKDVLPYGTNFNKAIFICTNDDLPAGGDAKRQVDDVCVRQAMNHLGIVSTTEQDNEKHNELKKKIKNIIYENRALAFVGGTNAKFIADNINNFNDDGSPIGDEFKQALIKQQIKTLLASFLVASVDQAILKNNKAPAFAVLNNLVSQLSDEELKQDLISKHQIPESIDAGMEIIYKKFIADDLKKNQESKEPPIDKLTELFEVINYVSNDYPESTEDSAKIAILRSLGAEQKKKFKELVGEKLGLEGGIGEIKDSFIQIFVKASTGTKHTNYNLDQLKRFLAQILSLCKNDKERDKILAQIALELENNLETAKNTQKKVIAEKELEQEQENSQRARSESMFRRSKVVASEPSIPQNNLEIMLESIMNREDLGREESQVQTEGKLALGRRMFASLFQSTDNQKEKEYAQELFSRFKDTKNLSDEIDKLKNETKWKVLFAEDQLFIEPRKYILGNIVEMMINQGIDKKDVSKYLTDYIGKPSGEKTKGLKMLLIAFVNAIPMLERQSTINSILDEQKLASTSETRKRSVIPGFGRRSQTSSTNPSLDDDSSESRLSTPRTGELEESEPELEAGRTPKNIQEALDIILGTRGGSNLGDIVYETILETVKTDIDSIRDTLYVAVQNNKGAQSALEAADQKCRKAQSDLEAEKQKENNEENIKKAETILNEYKSNLEPLKTEYTQHLNELETKIEERLEILLNKIIKEIFRQIQTSGKSEAFKFLFGNDYEKRIEFFKYAIRKSFEQSFSQAVISGADLAVHPSALALAVNLPLGITIKDEFERPINDLIINIGIDIGSAIENPLKQKLEKIAQQNTILVFYASTLKSGRDFIRDNIAKFDDKGQIGDAEFKKQFQIKILETLENIIMGVFLSNASVASQDVIRLQVVLPTIPALLYEAYILVDQIQDQETKTKYMEKYKIEFRAQALYNHFIDISVKKLFFDPTLNSKSIIEAIGLVRHISGLQKLEIAPEGSIIPEGTIQEKTTLGKKISQFTALNDAMKKDLVELVEEKLPTLKEDFVELFVDLCAKPNAKEQDLNKLLDNILLLGETLKDKSKLLAQIVIALKEKSAELQANTPLGRKMSIFSRSKTSDSTTSPLDLVNHFIEKISNNRKSDDELLLAPDGFVPTDLQGGGIIKNRIESLRKGEQIFADHSSFKDFVQNICEQMLNYPESRCEQQMNRVKRDKGWIGLADPKCIYQDFSKEETKKLVFIEVLKNAHEKYGIEKNVIRDILGGTADQPKALKLLLDTFVEELVSKKDRPQFIKEALQEIGIEVEEQRKTPRASFSLPRRTRVEPDDKSSSSSDHSKLSSDRGSTQKR